MSLRSNILANYASQIYVAVIGIVMVPMYMHYMGAEAYGLVGFFAMLQAWFQVLDMGLTPTMARESARFNGGAIGAAQLRQLLRAMEGIFAAVAVIGAVGLAASSGLIAEGWLKVQQLPIHEVRVAVILIAVIIALRWVGGLYRGAITGFEKLVWLGGFNIVFATARFVLVVPLFIFVGATPTVFFTYQLLLAATELFVLVVQTYRLFPKMESGHVVLWKWDSLRGVVKFSVSISVAGLAWLMATQADKLILSKLLPLAEYGYFTLVALVATGVLTMSSPISGALLPRLTKLKAEGDEHGLFSLYRLATRLVVAVAVPAGLVLSIYSDKVMWVWTGNLLLVDKVAPVLTLYAAGSTISVIAAFPYYLQYANGNLRLHLVGSFLFVLVFMPMLVYASRDLGMVGAGWAWLVSNILYFAIWVPIVHRKIAPGSYWTWLLMDVLAPSLPAIFLAYATQIFIEGPNGRLTMGFQLLILSALLVGVSIFGGSKIRPLLEARFLHKKKAAN